MELPAGVVDDLIRWEGATDWMYRDTRGLVTTGIGCMLESVEEAQKLPWRVAERRAWRDEVERGYLAVLMETAGKTAESYRHCTPLRLSDEAVRALALGRLTRFVSRLRWLLDGFDVFPDDAKRALIDMAWNLGVGGLAKFRQLIAACDARDWKRAANSCHRRTCRDERNEWTRDLFLRAALS